MPCEQVAWFSQQDGTRSPRALDKALTEERLQRCDLLAYRRLCIAQIQRGASKGASFSHGLERDEVTQFNLRPGWVLGLISARNNLSPFFALM